MQIGTGLCWRGSSVAMGDHQYAEMDEINIQNKDGRISADWSSYILSIQVVRRSWQQGTTHNSVDWLQEISLDPQVMFNLIVPALVKWTKLNYCSIYKGF